MKNEIQNASTGVGGLKNLLESPSVQKKLQDILGKRASVFATSIVQIVQSNDLLAKAEPSSVVGAAMTAATLNLPLNNSIGHAYIVPYNTKQKDNSYKTMAQFQLGYKGIKQLAMRSGKFKIMNDGDVRQGELVTRDRLTGEIEFNFEQDDKKREKLPVIGYFSYFRLLNGFEKLFYMSVDEIKAHAKKYSQTYKKGFGNWVDDFDSMARKTVVKLNLNSGEAPLSIDMQSAIETDQAVVNYQEGELTHDIEYVDNTQPEVDPELERIREYIENIQTQTEADLIRKQVPSELNELFMEKLVEKGLK